MSEMGEMAVPLGGAEAIPEHPEVVRRHAEWERQIESLDKKEVELHQCQLRLIRDQHATFVREFKALRLEVEGLNQGLEELREGLGLSHGWAGESAQVSERLKQLEKLAGDSADKHNEYARSMEELRGPQLTLTERMNQLDRLTSEALDRHGRELRGLKDGHERHGRDVEGLRASCAQLRERVEAQVEATERHGRELQSFRGSHTKQEAALAKSMRDLEFLRAAHEERAALPDRIVYLEKLFSDNAEKHGRDLQALREAHAGYAKELANVAHHASVPERLDFVEKLLGDSVERHARDVQSLKLTHEKHAKDLEGVKAVNSQCAILGERIEAAEKLWGDTINKNMRELQAVKANHDRHAKDLAGIKAGHTAHATLLERLGYLEKLLDGLGVRHDQELQAVRDTHAQHAKDLAGLKAGHAHHATFDDRMAHLEKALGDSSNKHEEKLEALRAAHAKHTSEFSRHAKAFEAVSGHHASLQERVGFLEGMLGDSADKHAAELDGLKASDAKHDAAHGKFARDLEAVKEVIHSKHSALEQRIELLDGLLSENGSKHAREMQTLKASHEKHAKDLGAMKVSHEQHAGFAERMDYLEKLVGDSADRHAQELQALKDAHNKHGTTQGRHAKELEAAQARHATLEERLEYVEKLVGDSADQHMKELQSLTDMHSKHQSAHRKLALDFETLKVSHAESSSTAAQVDDLQRSMSNMTEQYSSELATLRAAHAKQATEFAKYAKEVGTLPTQHTTLRQQVDHLEKVLSDSVDRTSEQLRCLQESHAQQIEDLVSLKVQHTHHASLPDRLSSLERRLGDTTDKHTKEVQALKTAYEKHAQELADTCELHSAVDERIKCLDSTLLSSSEKHLKELKTIKDAYSRHTKDIQDFRESLAQHASLPERLEGLEQILRDAADAHARDLQVLRLACAKHDAATGKHAKELEALKVGHSQYATLEESICSLGAAMRDSAENHTRELGEVQKKHEALLNRFESDRAARDKQHGSIRDLVAQERGERSSSHGSVQDRVANLEAMIGENLDKHAKEIAATKDAHAQLLSDARTRESHHGTLLERLDKLEKMVVDSSSCYEKELKATHATVDALIVRLNMVKEVWSEDTPRTLAT